MNYNVKNLTTSDLIDKCVSKDPPAWAEFVGRFSPLIAFSIKKALKEYSHTSVNEDAKDILQNVFISLWNNNKLVGITRRHNINYWLVIIARNAAIDHLRMQKKEILIEDKSYFENLHTREIIHEKTLQNIENLDAKLKRACKSLAPREKLIFKLYFKKNIKTKEIAKILNISIGNITSAISKIRKKIHRKI